MDSYSQCGAALLLSPCSVFVAAEKEEEEEEEEMGRTKGRERICIRKERRNPYRDDAEYYPSGTRGRTDAMNEVRGEKSDLKKEERRMEEVAAGGRKGKGGGPGFCHCGRLLRRQAGALHLNIRGQSPSFLGRVGHVFLFLLLSGSRTSPGLQEPTGSVAW